MTSNQVKQSSVSQGQKNPHETNVGSGVKLLDVDLNWGNKNNKLSLIPYTPSRIPLEKKYDKSDGSVDGRVTYQIKAKDGGYLEEGDWMFNVYGESVSGIEDYTIKLYARKKIA